MDRVSPSKAQLDAIASRHLGSPLRRARTVHHHCNTHVYIATQDGSRVILRICDGPYWRETPRQVAKLRREQYAWGYLRELEGVHTPEVIAVETEETLLPHPYLIMTHLPGRGMDEVFPMLSLPEQLGLLEDLGALAHSIHALDVDLKSLPVEMFRWPGPRTDILFQVRDLAEAGLMTPASRAKVERLVQTYAWQLAVMDEDMVFLHGDLFFSNILLEREKGKWRISGPGGRRTGRRRTASEGTAGPRMLLPQGLAGSRPARCLSARLRRRLHSSSTGSRI